MSKQTAAVAVKGGSGVDSSSPPANVIKLWKEVEDKLLLQQGKAYISDQTRTYIIMYVVIMMHLLKLLFDAPLI